MGEERYFFLANLIVFPFVFYVIYRAFEVWGTNPRLKDRNIASFAVFCGTAYILLQIEYTIRNINDVETSVDWGWIIVEPCMWYLIGNMMDRILIVHKVFIDKRKQSLSKITQKIE